MVSVLFMVLDLKRMGVALMFVLVVYVEPISPYAEIMPHSIGGYHSQSIKEQSGYSIQRHHVCLFVTLSMT